MRTGRRCGLTPLFDIADDLPRFTMLLITAENSQMDALMSKIHSKSLGVNAQAWWMSCNGSQNILHGGDEPRRDREELPPF